MIRFHIVGMPAAQGSKRHVGNGVMVEMAKGHKPWRDSVANAAHHAARDLRQPLDGPLALEVQFRFPMPASRRKADKERGWCWKVSAPDTDKLIRALGDGLQSGGLIRDDARLVDIRVTKLEVIGWTGATVTLTEAEQLVAAPELRAV